MIARPADPRDTRDRERAQERIAEMTVHAFASTHVTRKSRKLRVIPLDMLGTGDRRTDNGR